MSSIYASVICFFLQFRVKLFVVIPLSKSHSRMRRVTNYNVLRGIEKSLSEALKKWKKQGIHLYQNFYARNCKIWATNPAKTGQIQQSGQNWAQIMPDLFVQTKSQNSCSAGWKSGHEPWYRVRTRTPCCGSGLYPDRRGSSTNPLLKVAGIWWQSKYGNTPDQSIKK